MLPFAKKRNNHLKKLQNTSQNSKAFTLIELLVVISIIAVLMALMMPALRKARMQAKMIVCKSNQKQIATAAILYASSNDGKFPPCITYLKNKTGYGFPGYLAYHPGQNWPDHPLKHGTQRMMSTYLGDSVEDGSVFLCPLAPPRDIETIRRLYADPFNGDGTYVCSYNMFWGGYEIGKTGNYKFKGPKTLAASSKSLLIMDSVYEDTRYDENVYTVHKTPFGGSDIGQAGIWGFKGNINESIAKVSYNTAYSDGHVEVSKGRDFVPLEFNSQISMYLPENSVTKVRK